MGTTSLVVELLIIGSQVTTWVILLLLSIYGYKWIDLKFLTDGAGLITLALIAASYSLAMILEVIHRTIFAPLITATYQKPAETLTNGATRAYCD